ncbi:MAG: magnesium and cobalt transport protein CorA [Microbacterium sp.]|nr:magnesium and cobalt transport protein CorA [Microbacterium sp.]MBA4346311.1 magnesium and cobalt transport protein CorA [Microbacterium sp.]
MAVVDSAVYVEGLRRPGVVGLDETYDVTRETGGIAWIGLYRPTRDELHSVATEFGLHHLAVDDALKGHQRSKLERYGNTLFLALRTARYIDETETVEFGELHVFVGPQFVITVRHAESPDLAHVRDRLEADPELLAKGPEAILYAVLDEVVDEYEPVIAGLENDIDEIEDELFGDAEHEVLTRRIYDLSSEVIGFQRAVQPLIGIVGALQRGGPTYGVDSDLTHLLGDVLDHVSRAGDRADAFRTLLDKALQVQSTLITRRMTQVSVEQNEQIKRITSWAAILFAPTLVGTVYGMNFRYMPELQWVWGYPFAIGLMVLLGVGLYVVFKRRDWL